MVLRKFTAAPLPGETPHGGFDAYLRKYAPSGRLLWTRQFGGRGDEYLADLAVDELTDMTGVDEATARALIMKAREHWFTA